MASGIVEPHPSTTITLTGRGIEMAVQQSGPEDGPTVLFSHGFPELGYSWRYQLKALGDAGYRAIAPDQRGYGGTTTPEAIEEYRLELLCGDMIALLDELSIDDAIIVGHDWGGEVAWGSAVMHPDRIHGVVGVCTPYMAFPTTTILSSLFPNSDDMYMLWFQEPGVAEGHMDAKVQSIFDKLFRGGISPEAGLRAIAEGSGSMNPFKNIDEFEPIGEPVTGRAELDYFIKTFERTGFAGGINWYRNIDRNAVEHPEIGSAPIEMPTLMICAEWDPVLPPALAAGMGALCSDLETVTVPGAGHWIQQEKHAELNSELLSWLTRRFPV